MVGQFEAFKQIIELREPFFHVPLIIFAVDFDGEVNSILLGFILLKGSDGDFDW